MRTDAAVTAPELVLGAQPHTAARRLYRSPEYVLIGYFLLGAVRAHAARQHPLFVALDLLIPLVITGFAVLEQRVARRWVSIVRDWIPMPLLLVAYWNVDAANGPMNHGTFEHHWIGLDRFLLNGLHLRAAIEGCGFVLPGLLELCYSLLYALPPVMLGAVYLMGQRRHADRYLFPLTLGAMTAYALLPLFPSLSPRIAFPGQDLPTVVTWFRTANVWLLDHCDIRTSVFPSGHVSVAFSAAFGMLRVAPRNRRTLVWLVFLFATLVAINTCYGRYHYAVDGIAGFAIATAAYFVSRTLGARD